MSTSDNQKKSKLKFAVTVCVTIQTDAVFIQQSSSALQSVPFCCGKSACFVHILKFHYDTMNVALCIRKNDGVSKSNNENDFASD